LDRRRDRLAELAAQFVQQRFGRPRTPRANVPVALDNLRSYFRVAQLKVVLQFIGVHDADHGNTVLF